MYYPLYIKELKILIGLVFIILLIMLIKFTHDRATLFCVKTLIGHVETDGFFSIKFCSKKKMRYTKERRRIPLLCEI